MQRYITIILFFLFASGVKGQQIVQRFYENSAGNSLLKLSSNSYVLSGGQTNGTAYYSILDSLGHVTNTNSFFSPNFSLNIFQSVYDGGNFIYHRGGAYFQNVFKFLFFVKSDLSGNVITCKKFTTSLPSGVIQFAYQNGKLTFCGGIDHGYVSSTLPQIKDNRFMVFQTDDNFNVLWAKEYRYKIEERLLSIAPTSDGGFIVQGTTYDSLPTPARQDLVTMKLDSLGNVVWAKQAGSPSFPLPGTSVAVAYTGKVAIFDNGDILNGFNTSWYNGTMMNTNNDVILQKLDSAGNEITSYRYGNSIAGEERISDLIIDDNQNVLFTSIFLFIKANSNLVPQWVTNNRLLNLNQTNYYGIVDNSDSSYSIIGNTYTPSAPNRACFLKTNTVGKAICHQWPPVTLYMQPEVVGNFDITNQIIDSTINLSDSVISISQTNSPLIDSLACFTSTGSEDLTVISINVFPRITKQSIFIDNRNSFNTNCQAKIYSCSGKLVLFNELKSGLNEIKVSSLSQGLYLLQVIQHNKYEIFKIIKQ